MSYVELLNNLGFDSDPFAKTNADEEEKLDQYYIRPAFFNAVFGDYSAPKSSIVFAPRGSGKTALKRMIEIQSSNRPLLCVTYNQFHVHSLRLEDITPDYHLQNIIRLVLVAILTSANDSGVSKLSKEDRHYLYLFIKCYLVDLEQEQLRMAIDAVKNFGTKVKETWNKFTGPIGVILNNLLSSIGFESVELKKFDAIGGSLGSPLYQLQILETISKKLGFNSIYVLVDRIDENPLTGSKASDSYQFIGSLLKDLQLLELPGFGFKFFLWDLLLPAYQLEGRPDRIKYYEIRWESPRLKSMLSERIKAYSNHQISCLNDICETGVYNIDDVVILLSQGSPRNVIRLCKEIIDQQSEIDHTAKMISKNAIVHAIETFAEGYTSENLPATIIRELKKTKRASFTAKYVYSDVFKFTQQAGISKIKTWQDAGAVENIGRMKEIKGKYLNIYSISTFLYAKHIFSDLDCFQFMKRKTFKCPFCGSFILNDWDMQDTGLCTNCQGVVNINQMPLL